MLVWLRSSCIYGSSKAPVFTVAMWDVWECEEAAPRNLVLQCVAMEQEMCIHYGLWPRESGLPGGKPDTLLSRLGQGQVWWFQMPRGGGMGDWGLRRLLSGLCGSGR